MESKPLDSKLLLLNSITLLYRESQLPGTNERSSDLVRNVLGLVRLPNTQQVMLDPTSQILSGLKRLASTMADDPAEHSYEENEILQQVKLYCGEDVALYEAFERGVSVELKEASIKKTCLNLRRSLTNQLRNENVKTFVQQAHTKLQFRPEEITDMPKFLGEHIALLEPYLQDASQEDPAIITRVNFKDVESIKSAYKTVQANADGSAILRTGWQGINRMTRGGFRRGEQWVFSALPHMNKSGFTLDLYRQLCMYNKPLLKDPTKRPLILFYSFENSVEANMQYLYCKLKANENGTVITEDELKKLSIDEISVYVQDQMESSGYESQMLRVDPTKWDYRALCNDIIKYESEGFEIHAVFVDYLYMLPTTGCTQGPHGHDVRDLFRRTRNYFSAKGITLITPHQISTQGKQLVRNGQDDFVKSLPGKGYYAGSSQIDQEVDGEIFLHIEKVNGRSYQTYQRGKHRLPGQTPLIDQYCVHLFHQQLGILDDVNGDDTTLRRPGGGRVGSGEETPFWETDGHANDAAALFA